MPHSVINEVIHINEERNEELNENLRVYLENLRVYLENSNNKFVCWSPFYPLLMAFLLFIKIMNFDSII